MLQATLRPMAQKFPKNNSFHFFPYKSVCDQIWPWCRSRSTQGHNLNNLGSTCIDMYLPSFKVIGLFVLEKKILKVFTTYGHGGHVGQVSQLILYKFSFPFSLKLPYELCFQITQLFLRKTSFNFEIWVAFCQGQRMTLTFDTHSTSLSHLVEWFKHLWDLWLQ